MPLAVAHPAVRDALRAAMAAALAAGVACGAAGDEVLLVGTVERTLIELDAPVSETLLEVPVRRGQEVHRGDVLARIDPTLVEADVAHAEATLAGARTGLVTAEHELA